VPASVRQTVEEVARIARQSGSATVQEVAKGLNLDKSAASRRCRTAESRGYIRNEETSRGRPARYVLADALPAEQAVLPPPDVLASTLAGQHDSGNGCSSNGGV
jgi:DNA-binding MarR family transcriptional regulator